TQDDDMVFINNAFDYPLAHSFTLFKQVESNVAEIWEVRHMTWQHSQLHVFLLKDVMAYSIAAKFSINFVAKRWLLEKYQDEDLGIQPLVNLSAVFSSESSETLLVPTTIIRSNESANLFSVSCTASNVAYSSSYTAAKNAMQKKKAYAETIGIARKAINIAIEKDDLQVLKFLKGYILQNDHSLVENTTIVCSSSSRTSILEERSEPNTILEKPQVKVTNPIKKVRRGRPPKAITVDGMPNMRIRACDSTMTCEFCGGGGHNKELHKLDHSINDENEWVDSNSSSSESEEIEMDTE
ncbi:10730_t:CDS:2, partial [Gigaspora rosea]